jgi:hypothetical protein
MPRYTTYSQPLPRMRSLLLPLIALAATGASAHEGHDHDHAQVVEEPPKPVESLAHSFTVSRQLISQALLLTYPFRLIAYQNQGSVLGTIHGRLG